MQSNTLTIVLCAFLLLFISCEESFDEMSMRQTDIDNSDDSMNLADLFNYRVKF